MSASTEDFQRRALRRNRLIATALLGAVLVLIIALGAFAHNIWFPWLLPGLHVFVMPMM